MSPKPTKQKSKSTNPVSKSKTDPLRKPKKSKKRGPIRVRCTFMDCSARKRRPKQSLQCRRKVLLPDPSQSRVGVRCRRHVGNVPDPTYESSNDADCSGYDENTPEGDDDKMGEVEYDEPPDLKSK